MMRTEPGQMQLTQGLLAPIGAISGQPLPPEGEVFATVFGKPLPVPVMAENPMPTVEATGIGAIWAVIAPASGPPFLTVEAVAPPDLPAVRLDAPSVESGDMRLEAWEDVPLPGPPSVLAPTGEGMESMAFPQTLGSGSSTVPHPSVVPGPGARWTDPSLSTGGSLPSGPAPFVGITDEKIDRVPQEGPIAQREGARPSAGGADVLAFRVSEPSTRVQAGEEPLSRRPDVVTAGLPTEARGVGGEGGAVPAVPAVPATRAVPSVPDRLPVPDRPAVHAVPAVPATRAAPPVPDRPSVHDGPAVPAVPAVPATRAVPLAPERLSVADRPAVSAVPAVPATRAVPLAPERPSVSDRPSVPAVPAMTSGVLVQVPAATDDAPIPLASQPPDPGRGQAAEPNADSPPVDADQVVAPSARPVVTEAERVWLGRLHWHDAHAGGIESTVRETTPPTATSEAATPIIRAGHDPKPVVQANAALPATALQTTDLEEPLPQQEPDLSPITWSPAGQMVLTGSAAAGPLPAGTVPQFAAAMVATLHQKADGTTEIALSPDELGSVRLRLEADARDPERMIVHLVFDRPETMDLFRRHADQLSEAIRAAGYAEARLDFGQSGTGADPRGGEQVADSAKPPPSLVESDQARVPPTFDRPSPPRLANTAGLDLRL